MSVQIALFLLTVCSVVTSLIVEALKKMFTVEKPTTLAAFVAVAVGILVPVGYMILYHMTITAQDIVYIVGMVVLTWLCATLGYDTVMTAIGQFRK